MMVEIFQEFFSNWMEIHAFVIGLSLGVITILLWSPHRKVALSVLVTSLTVVLIWPTAPMKTAAQKPWYFLVAITTVLTIGIKSSPVWLNSEERAFRQRNQEKKQ
jgi:hypothetical protein